MKKKNIIFIVTVILLMFLVILSYLLLFNKLNKENNDNDISLKSSYKMEDNNLSDFDLVFLQLENNKKNKVYSPLSIKYALSMLKDASREESYMQINDVLGDYKTNKYINSENISLANAMFIKNSFKDNIKNDYINTLEEKYAAEIIYDDFNKSDNLNNWVSNKTFKLIDNLFDNISDKDYILVNALAIDMEWKNKIQSENENYTVSFPHEKFDVFVPSLLNSGYHRLEFNDLEDGTKSVIIKAVANRYDILNTLGEENIRETVTEKYQQWLNEDRGNVCYETEILDTKTYVDNYIKDINKGYNSLSASTDFKFYIDDNIKIFSKELKKYNNITLEYIGIMPIEENLNKYISNIDINEMSRVINNLKSIELSNFQDGVITEITGYIPIFQFDYKLKLKEDLIKLGIIDVFDIKKANLSNLTIGSSVISEAKHKANIEFSNNGIKAGAATAFGGVNSALRICSFDYLYEVPVERIDLTFDKPYLFIIRDKYSGEVWFVGTVYEPMDYKKNNPDCDMYEYC